MSEAICCGEDREAGQTMEEVSCNICGGDDVRQLFQIERYDTVFSVKRCRNCGLAYLNPRPTSGELDGYYSQVYNYSGFLKSKDSIKQRCRVDIELIQRYKKGGNLLEVGCMFGFLLDQARQHEYNPYGVEISQQAAEYAKDTLGLDVHNGRLEESSFGDRFFDVVFLSHLIEHLEDPSASLKFIHRIMKDDGVLIMKCPNFGSLMSKLTRRHWWWIAPPEHLYHFTPKTISSLLRSAGFSRIEISTNHGDLGYLRYLSIFFVKVLPIPRSWKVNYRATIDSHPEHLSQKILLSVYNLARPIVALIHKINMGEEMVVVARK